jgi:hypothetical protein
LIINPKHVFTYAIIIYWHTLVCVCMHFKPRGKEMAIIQFSFSSSWCSFLPLLPKTNFYAGSLLSAFKQKLELDMVETYSRTYVGIHNVINYYTFFKNVARKRENNVKGNTKLFKPSICKRFCQVLCTHSISLCYTFGGMLSMTKLGN